LFRSLVSCYVVVEGKKGDKGKIMEEEGVVGIETGREE
jgi:hypothetical protein